MSRGGKRRGAGRPPGSAVLTWEERIIVAAECEKRRTAIQDASLKAARDALFSKSDYDSQISQMKRQPDWRRDYVPIRYDDDGAPIYRTDAGEYHGEDIEAARKQMAGMDAADLEPAPTVFHITAPRPHRYRAKVLADVAVWASARFGKAISATLVNSCWKALRRAGRD